MTDGEVASRRASRVPKSVSADTATHEVSRARPPRAWPSFSTTRELPDVQGLPLKQRLLAHQRLHRRITSDELRDDLVLIAEAIDELSFTRAPGQQAFSRCCACFVQTLREPPGVTAERPTFHV